MGYHIAAGWTSSFRNEPAADSAILKVWQTMADVTRSIHDRNHIRGNGFRDCFIPSEFLDEGYRGYDSDRTVNSE